jgi:molybdopterin biosynthesis enzyme
LRLATPSRAASIGQDATHVVVVIGGAAVGGRDSSVQRNLATADLLIRRRPGVRAPAGGELVEVLPF